MARRVFFSFHYDRDIWRANVVRNSWITHPNRESSGFWDASLWEEAKTRGDAAVQRLISQGLQNTSVTAVLVGPETASRRWVRYEIAESVKRGNGLLGIRIHNIKDRDGLSDLWGVSPFDGLRIDNGRGLTSAYPMYDWVQDEGYKNLGRWVEAAAPKRTSPSW